MRSLIERLRRLGAWLRAKLTGTRELQGVQPGDAPYHAPVESPTPPDRVAATPPDQVRFEPPPNPGENRPR